MTTVAIDQVRHLGSAGTIRGIGWRRRAAFALFILVNVALFLRPTELFEGAQPLPIYESLILICLALVLPELVSQLEMRALRLSPITVCVVGLVAAAGLSRLSHLELRATLLSGMALGRVAVYYLLVVALVDSPERLLRLVKWLAGLTLALTILALLGYHGWLATPAISPLEQRYFNPETWEEFIVRRLRGPGIFNDPNDMCLVVVPGMVLWSYWVVRAGARRRGVARLLALTAIAVLGYGLMLTRSRGGFLVLLAGLCAFLLARLGWRRMLPWACVLLPLLFLVFAGRQTDIDLADREDTAQTRIQIWSEGLDLFRRAPLFGVGQDQFADEVGIAAHNSFVQCYSELGIVGGTLFFSAFYLALRGVYRANAADVRLRALQPCLFAMIAAYVTGMLTLSRAYIAPTYLMLGLATAFLRVAAPVGVSGTVVDVRLVRRLLVASAFFLIVIYLFVRLTVRWV